MAKLSKRRKLCRETIDKNKQYSVEEAFVRLQGLPRLRFRETVDAAINLGVDPRKSDQVVRGSTVLPHGTGKAVRVAVFTQGANVDVARNAGADLVGLEDLAEQVKGGTIDFDVAVATPDAMRVVGQLGQILGPRGLMPNPKVGTVTPDVATAVKNVKGGQIRYRTDRAGIIHAPIGKVDFEVSALSANLGALVADLIKAKPANAKGVYMQRVTVSTTMGPGVFVDQSSIPA